MEIAIAKHAFQAKKDGQISFPKGAEIVVVDKKKSWWRGRYNGEEGTFPYNYVELQETQAEDTNEKYVIAIHAYEGKKDSHLTFEKGARIRLIEEKDEKSWWKGEYNGKIGSFPGNRVKHETASSSSSSEPKPEKKAEKPTVQPVSQSSGGADSREIEKLKEEHKKEMEAQRKQLEREFELKYKNQGSGGGAELAETLTRLEQEISALRTENRLLEKTLEDERQRKDEETKGLREQVIVSLKETASLQTEAGNLSRQLGEAQQQAQIALDDARTNEQKLSTYICELENDLKQEQTNAKKLQMDLEMAHGIIDDLRRRQDRSHESSIIELTGEVANIDSEIKTSEVSLAQRFETLQAELAKANKLCTDQLQAATAYRP
eukprot:GCRY01000891.1.p1 GENE.GCRY01000891.1~~GCRY01000891.1.p1  ORF type:complete len:377 (+),score=119.63 GCRY01000891.1:299-1429(+)